MLDAGIGVSAGPVVAGYIGAEERFEYTVIGDPVNEAARLSDLAKGEDARVLASAAVLDLAHLAESDEWDIGRSVILRGRSRPTRLGTPRWPALPEPRRRRGSPASGSRARCGAAGGWCSGRWCCPGPRRARVRGSPANRTTPADLFAGRAVSGTSGTAPDAYCRRMYTVCYRPVTLSSPEGPRVGADSPAPER
ncbi:adenylate/guanylate cyclase domain-containing protein [Actinomadura madurae]|uniref:adenylate/guanylate cyclase domain-containing protein n=1 Tax=Actinomadura madurae TaxID=1993 RepID=UPI0020D25D44|nr:adenylate/guanylate cyclase domain-containing protein [Actinomadura madurae]MCQ0016839.1 adenylate/guanylate cyclase domain-containing protein [Actinomadura madurae]